MKILLIEPNKILAAQYASALKPAEVAWCRDAQSAVLKVDKQKPDLIITELLMSQHSGIEFLYELRTYPEWRTIPVIILSSVGQAESGLDKSMLERLGVAGYLYKPGMSLGKLADFAAKYVPAKA